jgi:hypothetical protein
MERLHQFAKSRQKLESRVDSTTCGPVAERYPCAVRLRPQLARRSLEGRWRHRGTINVRSRPGIGTTFSAALPLTISRHTMLRWETLQVVH